VYEHSIGFSDTGMNDAVFEIIDVNHRRLVRFLPTDHEDTWPDWRDRNLNGLPNTEKLKNTEMYDIIKEALTLVYTRLAFPFL